MNHSKTFSRTLAMKGGLAAAISIGALLYFTILFTMTSAAPQAAVCTAPVFPVAVGNETELNDAIDCFNQETILGLHVITLTQNISLSESTLPISNTNSLIQLNVKGAGFTLDAEEMADVRPLAVYTGTFVLVEDLTVTGGNIITTVVKPQNNGGGIQNFGNLALVNTDVVSNTVDGNSDAPGGSKLLTGGGIYNYNSATLVIVNSNISHNSADQDGGGIENRGTLTITDSTIENNTAFRFSGGIGVVGPTTISQTMIISNTAVGDGGGIYNNVDAYAFFVSGVHDLDIYNSLIEGNSSEANGGGIFNDTGAELNVYDSTFSGNISDADIGNNGDGGALYSKSGSSSGVLENVTVSGNTDSSSGSDTDGAGGVYLQGAFTLTHVTIVSNTGTINFFNSGNLGLVNSIFAGHGTSDCSNTGTILTNSGNLIQTDDPTNACGGAALAVDPELDGLADNGGETETHLPRTGSPVIGAAPSSCLATDQRGVSRVGSTCEMGAIEIIDTTVSIADMSVTEGTGGSNVMTFTMTRSDTTEPVTVTVNTSDDSATAGSDYTALVGEVVAFDAGMATKQIGITVTTDSQVESNEAFTVTLSNPDNAVLSDDSATGTINDDDTATLTLSGASEIDEGDAGTVNYVFTATLSAAVEGGFDVDVSTIDGTATEADNDYNPITSTLSFAGNANEAQTMTVTVVGDTMPESDETFSVSFGTITNTMLAGSISAGSDQVGTISDDDGVSFSLSVGATSVNEADTTIPVTVTLSQSSAITTSVLLETGGGSATAGDDYTTLSQTLEFAVGEITKTITVTIKEDAIDELDETFDVILSAPVNGSLGSPSNETITIVDNDGTPGINLENTTYSVDENAGVLDVVVTLTNASGVPVSVTLKSADVTASAGSDYTAVDELVVFAAGEISQTVSVSITNDALYEGDETLTLTISDPVNGILSTDVTAAVTINEDDALPLVTINNVSQAEGDTTGVVTFTISLDKAIAVPVSIGYMTQDDTAKVVDGDYSAKSGTLSIAAGETSGTVVVTVNGDTTEETDESFVLILTTVSNGTLDSMLSGRTGTATLTNDDTDPVTSFTILLPLVVK